MGFISGLVCRILRSILAMKLAMKKYYSQSDSKSLKICVLIQLIFSCKNQMKKKHNFPNKLKQIHKLKF